MTVEANTPKLRNAINTAINDALEQERAEVEVVVGESIGAEQEKEELVRREDSTCRGHGRTEQPDRDHLPHHRDDR